MEKKPQAICLLIYFLLMLFQASYADLADDLIAYYPFNGSASDESGNNRHGQVYGADLVYDRFGNKNSAYYFDGDDDYIDIGEFSIKHHFLTVSLWLKTTKGRNNHAVLDWNNSRNQGGVAVQVGVSGDPATAVTVAYRDSYYFGGAYPRLKGGKVIADGEWHHVVFMYNGDGYVYMDGELEGFLSRKSGAVLVNKEQKLYIGHRVNQAVGNYHFDGLVDDVRIYSRGLSEAEIKQLYCEENDPIDGSLCTSVSYSREDLEVAYEDGRQACILNPSSCGTDGADGVYQQGRLSCINSPLSCGIAIGYSEAHMETVQQESYLTGVTEAQIDCRTNPSSCGIFIGYSPSQACVQVDYMMNVHIPCVEVEGTKYQTTLLRYNNVNDADGVYWKLGPVFYQQ